jgi:hypothetical protein
VTASRGVIRPGEGRSFMVLTASPDAKPGLRLRTRPVARAKGGGRLLERAVRPYEFRDHCRTPIASDEVMITVGRPARWTVSIESAGAALVPGRELTLHVKARREQGQDGDLPLFIMADHAGVRFKGLATVPAGANESSVVATLKPGSTVQGPIRVVVVSGLNEWIGVTSGAMNRSSAALELRAE